MLWGLAAGLPALLTRNPGYLALIGLAAWSVDEAVRAYEHGTTQSAEPDIRRQGWGVFWRLGLLLAGVGALLNGLNAHVGATVLARLPAEWPLVGGPLTLEAFSYGALGGIALLTLLRVVGTFNTAADTYALLRAIPPVLAQAGLVTAIGLAYVPQTIVRVREIYEAQVLRGHRFRGPRTMLPLAVPLLGGGLDRALQLAEAMEARGFSRAAAGSGAATVAAPDRAVRALLALGTAGVAVGAFLMLYYRLAPLGGAAVLVAGLGAIGAALWRLSRASTRTRHRYELWRRRDSLVALLLLGSLGLTVALWVGRPGWWVYSPYPALGWPAFEPLAGLGLTLLAAPAVPLLRVRSRP